MSKNWTKEFALKGSNVRVNDVSLGYTMTKMMKTVFKDLFEQFKGPGRTDESCFYGLYD